MRHQLRRPAAHAQVALALLCAAAAAQDADPALEQFKVEFRAAVQLAAPGRPSDLRAASKKLDSAAAQISAIVEPRRRAQAELFVAVRRADFWFRGAEPDLAKIAAHVQAARQLARAAGVWDGPYQETALLLLWQTMPAEPFFALLDADAADLALIEGRKPATADNALPLRLVRADLRLAQGREREAIQELTEASASLREGASVSDAWAEKCHDTLVWRLMERREYARAEVYVPFLRDGKLRSNYQAQLSNQRGDFATTVRALDGTSDPRLLLLLADALEQLGRLDEARDNYDKVVRDRDASAELRAAAHNGLGDCHRRRDAEGDRARAAAEYQASLALLSGLVSRKVDAEIAENHRDLGLLAELCGDRAAAYAAFQRALDKVDAVRQGIPLDPFGAEFLEPQFLAAVDGVLRTWASAGASPFEVLAAVDRVKARSLLDRVGTPRALEASAEVLAAVRRLTLARDAAAQHAARLDLERARAAVAERAQLTRAKPLSAGEVRAVCLAEAETLLFAYWLGQESAWLLMARGERAQVLELGSAADALNHLREAYTAVADVAGDPWPVLARAGAFFLPDAVAEHLHDDAHVVLCPDDRLARVPFEALRRGEFVLGLRCDVERAASLAVRAQVARREAQGQAVVVVDSVPFSAQERARLGVDELRFSAREGDLVAAAWPAAVRLRETAAALAELRAQLARAPARLLHLSTHAVRQGAVPSSSLLLLADGATPLSSLTELPLDGATVLLSACATATGEARGGEGDAALLWGPFGAGARCVVASLWRVNQQATCDLMGQLHYALAQGDPEPAALRRARRALAGADNYAHPHYWAGFASFGAGSAAPRSRWWLPASLGLALCAALLVIWRRYASR